MVNTWNDVKAEIPLDELAKQLATLREAVKTTELDPSTTEEDRDIAVGQLRQAEKAAENDDGPGALAHLKTAGAWLLKVTTSVGVPIAIAAIKAALGIPV